MKKNFLAFMMMLSTLMFTACQTQDDVKPSKKSQANEELDPAFATTNARSYPVIKSSSRVVDTGTGFHEYTLTVSGKAEFCAPNDKLIVYWYKRDHDDAGNITSEVLLKRDWRKYACIQSGVNYATTGFTLYGGQHANVSFYARFYKYTPEDPNYSHRLIGDAQTDVVSYWAPQTGL